MKVVLRISGNTRNGLFLFVRKAPCKESEVHNEQFYVLDRRKESPAG